MHLLFIVFFVKGVYLGVWCKGRQFMHEGKNN